MLLVNFVVEEKVYNSSFGTVKKIVYKNKEGPRATQSLASPPLWLLTFMIQRYPKKSNVARSGLLPGYPVKPTLREEMLFSEYATVPLRVVKAISGHMCQRQMVGEGQLFKKFVIGLPQPNENKTQALEMTMRTRAKRMEDFAIDIESEITPNCF